MSEPVGAPERARNLADRLDAQVNERMAPFAYEVGFGASPVGVWSAPGTVVPLVDAGGDALAVPVDRGLTIAGGPRRDGKLEIRWMDRPAEAAFMSGEDVAWWAVEAVAVARALRSEGVGVSLMIGDTLPPGPLLGPGCATACATALALRGLHNLAVSDGDLLALVAAAAPSAGSMARYAAALTGLPTVLVGGVPSAVPFDLGAARLRLVAVATGVRGEAPSTVAPAGTVAMLREAFSADGPFALAGRVPAGDDGPTRAALSAGALAGRAVCDADGLLHVLLLVEVERLLAVRRAVASVAPGARFVTLVGAPL